MTFLKNAWYVAATPDEVCTTPLARKILGEQLVLYRGDDGEPHIIGGVCPHRFASLAAGKVRGGLIECPYHGLQFDGTGACVHNPHGDGIIPPNARVNSYPSVTRFDYVWVWMGDQAADLDLIPDFSDLARDDLDYFDGHLEVAANYQLIVDNLLDLSHTQYLHPFLSSDEFVANVVTTVETRDGMVYGTNRAKNIPTFLAWRAMYPEAPERAEHRLDWRWSAPSHVYLDNRYITADIEIFGPNAHCMTPIDEKNSHYFYRVGRSAARDDAEVHEILRQGIAQAFGNEDCPVIEQQQINMGDHDLFELNPAILTTDSGAVRARRILAHLIRRENGEAEPQDIRGVA